MKPFRAFAVPALVIAAGAYFLWPHLDRTASRVALSVTGLALILAWYSILDLQEQRHERFWPHTVDRLLRSTVTAITLVFVFNFAWPSPAASTSAAPASTSAAPVSTKAATESPAKVEVRTLVDVLNALVQDHKWDQGNLANVVAEHFAKMNGDGEIPLRLAGGQMFLLRAAGSGVTAKLVK